MKFLLIYISLGLLYSVDTFCQEKPNQYKKQYKEYQLVLAVIENSEIGITWHKYFLKGKKFSIYSKLDPTNEFWEHEHTIHRFNSKEFLRRFSLLGLDTLLTVYNNACIPLTSGIDYSIYIKKGHKTIRLHHYYKKEVEALIQLINEYFPKYQRISYLNRDTKQDCTND